LRRSLWQTPNSATHWYHKQIQAEEQEQNDFHNEQQALPEGEIHVFFAGNEEQYYGIQQSERKQILSVIEDISKRIAPE
jgi:NADPH-dependent ferric siderophore reductase